MYVYMFDISRSKINSNLFQREKEVQQALKCKYIHLYKNMIHTYIQKYDTYVYMYT